MSVILFVSPPRSAAQFFAETARRFPVRWHFFSVKPPVRSILAQCGVAVLPAAARLDAVTQPQPEVELPNYKRGGRLSGRAARLQQRLAATLARLIDTQGITALLVWNGSGLIGATAAALARQRGLPVLFAENGYFPNTMQLDPLGVNQASSATAVAREQRYRGYRAPPVDPVAVAATGRIAPLKPSRWTRVLPELCRLLRAETWSALLPAIAPKLPAQLPPDVPPYVFVPLQVSKDSQLLQYSPLLGNDFGRLLDHLSAALREQQPGWVIVVKPHPAEHAHVQRRYRHWLRRWPNVIFATQPSSVTLIDGARAVVTINSTVGFEAVVAGKPVLTLGENFYCFAPLVQPVARLEALPAALDTALRMPPDAQARAEFIDYVRHEFLIDCGYRELSPPQMARFVAALSRKLAAAQALLGEPRDDANRR